MRRAFGWGIATLLVLTTIAEGQTPSASSAQGSKSWWSWLSPFRKSAKAGPAAPKDAKSPVPVDSPVSSFAREKTDWLRRAAVCDRLREIAAVTNDDELDRQAEQLNQRAWLVFLKRTSQGSTAQAGLPSAESTLTQPPRPSTQSGQSLLTPAIRVRGSAGAREE